MLINNKARLHAAALATAVLAFPVSGALAVPTGVWSGITTGLTSGITWSWRFESKGDRVEVKVLGRLNGETYPTQCEPGHFIHGPEFVATCRYLKGAKGVTANASFELRADLDRDMTDVTYTAGSYVSHFMLQKERATAQPPPPVSAPSMPGVDEKQRPNQTAEAQRAQTNVSTAELRQFNGPRVAAISKDLKDQIGGTLLMGEAARQISANWYAQLFPQFVSWVTERNREGWVWTPASNDVEVIEYGTVQWKGRPLELLLTRSHIKLINRALGEYKEFCFLNGFVLDNEFQTRREPLFAICDQSPSPVAEYLRGLAFQSKWIAKSPSP